MIEWLSVSKMAHLFIYLRRELLQNKITKIIPNAFDGLSALKLLKIDSNPVNCDCSTMELKRKFQSRNARLGILCQKPSHFIGNSDSDDRDVFNCGEWMNNVNEIYMLLCFNWNRLKDQQSFNRVMETICLFVGPRKA